MSITYFQIITATAWGMTALLLLPSFVRAVFWRERPDDNWRGAVFLMGVLMAGFSGRWLVAPGHENLWRALYIASAATALYVMLLLWNGRKK